MSDPIEPKSNPEGAPGAPSSAPPSPAMVDPESLAVAAVEDDLLEEIEFAASALGPADTAARPAPAQEEPDIDLPFFGDDPSSTLGDSDWDMPEAPSAPAASTAPSPPRQPQAPPDSDPPPSLPSPASLSSTQARAASTKTR